jgi:plastocyanin
MQSSLAFITANAAIALANTVTIAVGQGGLTFIPNVTQADRGDKVQFKFSNSRHTVVQSDFSAPCNAGSLGSTGFNSGLIPSSVSAILLDYELAANRSGAVSSRSSSIIPIPSTFTVD